VSKKKRYIVVPRNEATKSRGLQTGKGKLRFGRKTAQWVDDPAIAREIDATYGRKGSGDVWVEQDENLEWHENNGGGTDGRHRGIHHYTFSGVDMTGIRATKNTGYVWVRVDGKQKRMKREEALAEGYEIVAERSKREKLRKKVSKASSSAPA